MSGYDAPFHLSEECSNANIASPRAIVLTSAIGGLFGWFLQLVVAYTVIDIDSVISSDLGQPWAAYLLQVMPQRTALAILALTIMCAFSMGQGCMVAASRVTFAYARDGCFPGSWWIARVNEKTRTPVNAVWFNTVIGVLLTLLIFGGPVAIGAIFSIGAIAAFVAFTIPIAIRVFCMGNRFRPGPWHLGRWSMPIGIAACSFVVVMVPVLCLPSLRGADLEYVYTFVNVILLFFIRSHVCQENYYEPKANYSFPSPTSMNWTALVYGAPMLYALVWWVVSARHWFKGPKVNIDHKMFGRGDQVLEGKIGGDESQRSSAGSFTKEPTSIHAKEDDLA